jgi:hypothetical protein
MYMRRADIQDIQNQAASVRWGTHMTELKVANAENERFNVGMTAT